MFEEWAKCFVWYVLVTCGWVIGESGLFVGGLYRRVIGLRMGSRWVVGELLVGCR